MSLSADRSLDDDVMPPDDDQDSPSPMLVAVGVGAISGAVLIGIPIGLALWPLWR